MTEEEAPAKKKRRKYTKRGPVKVTVEGKVYRGTEVVRNGMELTLKTLTGYVLVNTLTCKGPIEVDGAVLVPPNLAQAAPGGPQMSGGVAEFKARRDRQLEALTAMPGGTETE